ncbi:hypothetical protein KY329_05535 [Candidatus Woesearchaeota archaeon]|nr:hypothetical protein [Candidatus Woesearchaeota archaeon]
MIWQDYVVSISMFAFAYALIPQVIKGFKVKKPLITLQTAVINWAVAWILAFSFFTLGLVLTTIMNLIVGTLWAVLFFQNLKYTK